jgi:D-cysteine desulfhydrase family pyridoxal phosphate-dependent enzyme
MTAEPNSAAGAALSRAELEARIALLPRVRLAHLPTPLDHCPRLTAALGGPEIYVKRDDMTGLAFGGNKTRQLEFLLAEAVQQGADCVVAGAYTQSNWCRQITAAARKLALDPVLMLVHGEKGPRLQGNLLLDRLMGAEVTVVDGEDMEALTPLLEAKVAELRAAGRRPYLCAPFGLETLSLSAVGYVLGAIELDGQLAAAGVQADWVYMSGANITPAGMMLGLHALGAATRVVGITPIEWSGDRPTDIARIATATAARLGLGHRFTAADVINDAGYIGEKYGVVTPAGLAALELAARTEGLILDPVYTAKALSGLIGHIREGRVGGDETVVFLHTGGLPALFAYADDLGLD